MVYAGSRKEPERVEEERDGEERAGEQRGDVISRRGSSESEAR